MEFESAIKKNLWVLFQKYGFSKKIEPFHLRMKHNIIQISATASLTVPHSINPIFQSEKDQKIQTSSLKSRCTHNEWLFGANFGTVALLERYRAMLNEFLFPKIEEDDMEALKHEIDVAIHGIEAQTIKNVLKNWIDRMGYCEDRRGNHLNDVVFHT